MKRLLLTLLVCLLGTMWAQNTASLRGTVTDPSGAPVPNALIQVRGPGGEQRATSDVNGLYSFPSLRPGAYRVRVIAKGFTVDDREKVDVTTAMTARLAAHHQNAVSGHQRRGRSQQRLSPNPTSNGTAIVLGAKELETLSDDPDELQEQLQALAGPSAGPNGGQIYIDGFSGGNMPVQSFDSRSAHQLQPLLRRVRPAWLRAHRDTHPSRHGHDSRSGVHAVQRREPQLPQPSADQSNRPPYQQKFFGVNLSGPIMQEEGFLRVRHRAPQHRRERVRIATTLDSNFSRSRSTWRF